MVFQLFYTDQIETFVINAVIPEFNFRFRVQSFSIIKTTRFLNEIDQSYRNAKPDFEHSVAFGAAPPGGTIRLPPGSRYLLMSGNCRLEIAITAIYSSAIIASFMEIYIFITAESNFVCFSSKKTCSFLNFLFNNGIEIAFVNKVQYACIRILKLFKKNYLKF